MFRSSFVLSLLFASTACYNQKANAPESDIQTAEPNAALPITGTWKATQLWGFTENDDGRLSPLRANESQLNKDSWRLKFDLDSRGDGYLAGKVFCKTKATKIDGLGNNLTGSRVLLTANGIVGGLHLIATAVEFGRCMTSENGYIDSLVPVNRSSTFLGQPDPRIDKNLGFVGEGVSPNAAENECRKLRGVRFITVNNSSGCIGFRDAQANKIRFITVPPGAVHAVRVDFSRD